MCSHEEWERLTHRFEEAIDEGQVREFVADAIARVETLIEEFKAGTCSPEHREWGGGCGRRSRPEWVA
jgi:hypothetical protein